MYSYQIIRHIGKTKNSDLGELTGRLCLPLKPFGTNTYNK